MDRERIMIVDDDKNICELLRLYLEKEGFETIIANDGEQALSLFKPGEVSIVLLDIMMPRMDGWETCRRIRALSDVPVIMLTAKGETFDKVLGLELGADDYIVKPFDTKEVVARIKAVMRRYNTVGKKQGDEDRVLNYDKLSINLTRYELKVDGQVVDTPPKELELVYYLASNPNRVFTRDQLLDEVWGFEYYGDSRTIDVHVKRLREKLENVSEEWNLKTVWGVGYKFEVKE
jgi:Response regulators consisting of a CheY-like receiver domain and a winged-helix DNA-binding domain